MHASLRACLGLLAGTLLIVVIGLGFGRWPLAEAVHEPAVNVKQPVPGSHHALGLLRVYQSPEPDPAPSAGREGFPRRSRRSWQMTSELRKRRATEIRTPDL